MVKNLLHFIIITFIKIAWITAIITVIIITKTSKTKREGVHSIIIFMVIITKTTTIFIAIMVIIIIKTI